VIGTAQVAHHWHGGHDGNKDNRLLEDDLDGGPAYETVRFAIGGTDYEIDLNAKNAAAFRQQLASCLEHARKAATGSGTGRGGLPPAGSTARTSGPGRKTRASRSAAGGRIPASITQQYEAALGQP
jgi:nucleoid-associated protein Lsr2